MTRQQEDDALAALGLSHDGRVLIDILTAVLLSVAPPGIESCALHELEGRRRFASELIEKLTRDHAPGDRTARPRSEPGPSAGGSSARARGARRPIAADG